MFSVRKLFIAVFTVWGAYAFIPSASLAEGKIWVPATAGSTSFKSSERSVLGPLGEDGQIMCGINFLGQTQDNLTVGAALFLTYSKELGTILFSFSATAQEILGAQVEGETTMSLAVHSRPDLAWMEVPSIGFDTKSWLASPPGEGHMFVSFYELNNGDVNPVAAIGEELHLFVRYEDTETIKEYIFPSLSENDLANINAKLYACGLIMMDSD